ncbi:hypothetical protein Srubr_43430 [Streptomyces rubradiris]|uniref:Uncharacterized protein n=1 Tax=Streptomyces rubradiris TaxID=285531 RepID=A0ABQ3RFC0_STRRR|nr:hypothetical protein GCM10018792_08840 [Streptomyces rubradiris]GHI54497.1 hypothetical protein Srubr_43430 [Streptomyces rubradiris]
MGGGAAWRPTPAQHRYSDPEPTALPPADPDCRVRVFFGGGGLFRLRDGAWQDIEPCLTADDSAPGAPPGDDRTASEAGAPGRVRPTPGRPASRSGSTPR